MQYTIKKAELLKLAAAREIQTRETAESYFRETGFQIKSSAPEMNKDWARVRFVNGSTFELAVPVGKLAAWSNLCGRVEYYGDFDAKLGARHHRWVPGDEMEISFDDCNRVKLHFRGSEIAANCTGADSDETAKEWAARLGSPIPCVAPEQGGAFVVQAEKSVFNPDQDVVQAMKATRKVAAAQKKDASRRKAFATARQNEKRELASLKNGAAAYVAALSILAGGIAPEIARQKAVLAARRMLRRALLTPEIMPAWLPEVYFEERKEQVSPLNADGSPVIADYWQKDYTLAKGVAEYVGEKVQIKSYWIDFEDVPYTATIDAHEEFAGYVAKVQAARAELENYKPRKMVAARRYVSHRRGYQSAPLKQDKLALALKDAQEKLSDFIHEMFGRACETICPNTNPHNMASVNYTRSCLAWQDFSRAKITAREWSGLKGEICTRFIMARDERLNCESAMMQAGTVRARLASFEGKPGAAILVSASEIERVFQKAFDKGASVEILESKNPAYPVGIVAPKVAAIEPASVTLTNCQKLI